jgi:hypothetical protein
VVPRDDAVSPIRLVWATEQRAVGVGLGRQNSAVYDEDTLTITKHILVHAIALLGRRRKLYRQRTVSDADGPL